MHRSDVEEKSRGSLVSEPCRFRILCDLFLTHTLYRSIDLSLCLLRMHMCCVLSFEQLEQNAVESGDDMLNSAFQLHRSGLMVQAVVKVNQIVR